MELSARTQNNAQCGSKITKSTTWRAKSHSKHLTTPEIYYIDADRVLFSTNAECVVDPPRHTSNQDSKARYEKLYPQLWRLITTQNMSYPPCSSSLGKTTLTIPTGIEVSAIMAFRCHRRHATYNEPT
jgi:hypothetical protein